MTRPNPGLSGESQAPEGFKKNIWLYYSSCQTLIVVMRLMKSQTDEYDNFYMVRTLARVGADTATPVLEARPNLKGFFLAAAPKEAAYSWPSSCGSCFWSATGTRGRLSSMQASSYREPISQFVG